MAVKQLVKFIEKTHILNKKVYNGCTIRKTNMCSHMINTLVENCYELIDKYNSLNYELR